MIESFTEACCQDGGVLAVNGMAHGLTVRQILHKVAKELRLPLARSNDASATLKAIQAAPPDVPLYIVIHNIEGPGTKASPAHCTPRCPLPKPQNPATLQAFPH